MVPGCGQDIVQVDLMSGLSCGAVECCAPSLYRSSTGNSAAYVSLTCPYILGKSINISQRLITNAATKQNTSKELLYIYTPLLLCLLLLPLIYHYGCSERASDCRRGWDPNKRLWLSDHADHNKGVLLDAVMAEPSAQLPLLHTLFDKPLKHSQENSPEQGPCHLHTSMATFSSLFVEKGATAGSSKHQRFRINTKAILRPLHSFHRVTCNSNRRCSRWGLGRYLVGD